MTVILIAIDISEFREMLAKDPVSSSLRDSDYPSLYKI